MRSGLLDAERSNWKRIGRIVHSMIRWGLHRVEELVANHKFTEIGESIACNDYKEWSEDNSSQSVELRKFYVKYCLHFYVFNLTDLARIIIELLICMKRKLIDQINNLPSPLRNGFWLPMLFSAEIMRKAFLKSLSSLPVFKLVEKISG